MEDEVRTRRRRLANVRMDVSIATNAVKLMGGVPSTLAAVYLAPLARHRVEIPVFHIKPSFHTLLHRHRSVLVCFFEYLFCNCDFDVQSTLAHVSTPIQRFRFESVIRSPSYFPLLRSARESVIVENSRYQRAIVPDREIQIVQSILEETIINRRRFGFDFRAVISSEIRSCDCHCMFGSADVENVKFNRTDFDRSGFVVFAIELEFTAAAEFLPLIPPKRIRYVYQISAVVIETASFEFLVGVVGGT